VVEAKEKNFEAFQGNGKKTGGNVVSRTGSSVEQDGIECGAGRELSR
jgi:hypothetical protein